MVFQTVLVFVGLGAAKDRTLEWTLVLLFDNVEPSCWIVNTNLLPHVIVVYVRIVNLHLELRFVVHIHISIIMGSQSHSRFVH